MGKYEKLGKNIGILTIGNFATRFLMLLLTPFYTAVLTTEEYGTADLIFTTISLISPLFSLQISDSVMRYCLDDGNDKKQIFSIGIYSSILGFLIMLLFSPLILLSKQLSPYYVLFVLYYLVISIYNIVSQFIKGMENIKLYSISGILTTVFVVFFNLLFLLVFKLGIIGFLYSYIAGYLLTIIYLLIRANLKEYIISLHKLDKKLLLDMLYYAIPLIPNSMAWWINNSLNKYLLIYFKGIGLNGIYSVAYKIPSILSVISSIFMSAWQISSVEDFGSESSKKFFSNTYKRYSTLNIVIVSFLIMLTKLISKILFSSDFYGAWRYVPILLYGYIFYTQAIFLGSIYTAAKKTKVILTSTLIGSLSNIIINLVLIPSWEGIGASIAAVISYFITFIIRFKDSRKLLPIEIDGLQDVSCYLLLILQIIITYKDKSFISYFSILVFIIIFIIKRSILSDFKMLVTKMLIKS